MDTNKCNKLHYVKRGDKQIRVPCYFNAGVCIVDPMHEGGLSTFLRATYPYHHASTYEASKYPHDTLIPDIQVANVNA